MKNKTLKIFVVDNVKVSEGKKPQSVVFCNSIMQGEYVVYSFDGELYWLKQKTRSPGEGRNDGSNDGYTSSV